jgi:FkbM family methyltransferase
MPGISRFSFDQTVFLGYDPIDLDLLHFYRETKNEPKDGFITGFFGVRTRVTSLPQSIRPLSGKVLGIPWPNDYLAEAAEWIAMIKSVHEAETTFNMMELGAGWGPWLIEGAFSARKKGIENIYLVGVEADNSHFRTMEQHFRDNEFNPEDHTLLHGAAGTEDSVANWPVAEDSAEAWGHRPVRSSAADKEQDMHHLQDTIGKHPMQEIEVFDVKKLLRRKDTWNLLHIDIQGWETDIVADAISEIGERVQRLVIGTHSRRIEAELLEIMHREKWMLEAEKPCLFNYYNHHSNFESMTYVDGFQCWINPRFSEK